MISFKRSSFVMLILAAFWSASSLATSGSSGDSSASAVVNSNPSATATVNFGPKINSNNTFNSLETDLTVKNVGNSHINNDLSGSGNSTNDLSQKQNQNQDQNQDQGQDQSQKQNANANNTGMGNGNSVNFNTRIPHNTPGLGALFATPTAGCAMPIGGGGVGVGFGFNVITAYINQECVKQENTKLAFALGKTDTADEIFCNMEHTRDTLECMMLTDRIKRDKAMYVAARDNTPALANAHKNDIVGGVSNAGGVVKVNNTANDDIKRGWLGLKWDASGNQWVF